jgi:pimeloyl-ACP methyl ester carboxylesterase
MGTLVLVHGGGQGGWCWKECVRALRAAGHEVYAPTLTGFGERAHIRAAGFETYVEDIASLLDFEDLEPVVLVGHSMGGHAALALTAGRPELVERLVLVDTTPGSTPDRSQDLVDFVSARDFPSLDALVDHVAAFKPHRSRESLRRSVLLNARPTDEGRWTWRHDGRDRVGVDRWTRTFEELPKGWDHAAAVRRPTLVIRGDRSEIMLPSDVERYRQLVGDLRVLELADAGHNIHGDQPLALGDAIAAFADEGGDRS